MPAKFNFAVNLDEIRAMEQMAVHAAEIRWREQYCTPAASVDTVLWLGCNILRTPHLAAEMVAVTGTLGESVVAVAGGQFCCGAPHARAGDSASAGRIAGSTAVKLKSYAPRQVVAWCPNCHGRFNETMLGKFTPGFSIIHATEFLAEKVERLPFRYPVKRRVALHIHTGTTQRNKDAESAIRLLQAVPGVEIVGTLSMAELGSQCSPQVLNACGRGGFRSLRDGMVREAKAMGADTLATAYHSCQRAWCDVSDGPFQVRNWLSIVAESLGCAGRDYFQEYRKLADPAAIASLGRPLWESHGLTEEQARHAAGYFC